jgi:beta-glucosidase
MKNLGIKEVNILYAKAANISDDTIFAKKVNVFGTRIDIYKRSAQEMIDEAIAVAKQSDVIVAVVGASEIVVICKPFFHYNSSEPKKL